MLKLKFGENGEQTLVSEYVLLIYVKVVTKTGSYLVSHSFTGNNSFKAKINLTDVSKISVKFSIDGKIQKYNIDPKVLLKTQGSQSQAYFSVGENHHAFCSMESVESWTDDTTQTSKETDIKTIIDKITVKIPQTLNPIFRNVNFQITNIPNEHVGNKSDPYFIFYLDGELVVGGREMYLSGKRDAVFNFNFDVNRLFQAKRAEIEWWDRDVVSKDDLIGNAEIGKSEIVFLKNQISETLPVLNVPVRGVDCFENDTWMKITLTEIAV